MESPAPHPIRLGAKTAMRIVARERQDPAPARGLVPPRQRRRRAIEQRRECTGGTPEVVDQSAAQPCPGFVAPLAVGVDPFDGLDGYVPVGPGQLAARRDWMRRNAEAAEP